MRSIAPLTRLTAASAIATACLIPSMAAAASVPTPPETGCPSGWPLLSLNDLEGEGYIFRPDLDANADRYICGKPVAAPVQEQICATFPGGVCPVPIIYYVRDNDLVRD
jgi:hypothetical protein